MFRNNWRFCRKFSLQPAMVRVAEALQLINIAYLLQLYSNCLLHYADFENIIDLESSHYPYVLSGTISNGSIFFTSSTKSRSSLRCHVTVVTIGPQHSDDLLLAKDDNYLRIFHPQTEEDVPTQIYPKVYIFVTPAQFKLNKSGLIFGKLQLVTLPPVYLFHYETTGNSVEITGGALVCWFCENPLRSLTIKRKVFQRFQISCNSFHSCLAKGVMQYEKGTLDGNFLQWWRHKFGAELKGFQSLPGRHPFARQKKLRIADTRGAATAFLYHDINGTLEYPHRRNLYPKFFIFTHQEAHFMKLRNIQVIYTGSAPPLKFITMDSVFTERSSHAIYFSPFDMVLWIAIISFILFAPPLIIFVSSPTVRPSSVARMIMELVIWKFCTLIGQVNEPRVSWNRKRLWILNAVMAVWLGTTVVLSTHYQSVFSSDFTLAYPYQTKWQCIDSLQNFSILIPVSHRICKIHVKIRLDKFKGQDCIHFNAETIPQCNIWSRFMSKHRYYKYDMRTGTEDEKSYIKKQELKYRLYSVGAKFLCNDMPNIERWTLNLTQSKMRYAFVIFKYEFEFYWKIFAKLMKKHPHLKFASNIDTDDDFGVEPQGYAFTGGLRPVQQDAFVDRMHVLMSSGIYWLWIKWNHIVFTNGGLTQEFRMRKGTVAEAKAISLENSGLWWMLALHFVLLLLALWTLLAELFWNGVVQPKFRQWRERS